ncbi:MAG: PAS domain S-box protein [Alphaproteobacteria bacterium]|nr:PAS domain S-box protein [Alphaproteobacteria bacterium]
MPDRLTDSFFRALFNAPVLGMAVADIASRRIVATNPRLREILGVSVEEMEARAERGREFTPKEYHALDEEALRRLAETGHVEPFEKEFQRPGGDRVPVRVSASIVPEFPNRAVIFVEDISSERQSREREQAIQQRLQIALSAAEQGVWDFDLVTREMIYSDRAKEIYGLPVDRPVTYEIVRDATHPEDYPNTSAQLLRAIDPKVRDRSSYEYRIVRPDGAICWALAFGEAIFEGPPGAERAVRYVGTIQDITERKRAERRQQLLVAELDHRVKNTLAIVQGIAYQTLRGGAVPDAVAEAFAGRLQALASAHDILTKAGFETASLRGIAEAVLEVHDGEERRVRLDGKEVQLTPQLAVNLAIALHELATNAVKYGALSVPGGRVEFTWQQAEGRLLLTWRESGGPPVAEPEREGFGTRMIRRALASELRGPVTLEFRPEGLFCRIDAPLAPARGDSEAIAPDRESF